VALYKILEKTKAVDTRLKFCTSKFILFSEMLDRLGQLF
jgi:hypothetical protein